jgi:hypothetical protein
MIKYKKRQSSSRRANPVSGWTIGKDHNPEGS